MFYIKHGLAFIDLVLLVLLICGLCMTLFQSPLIEVNDLMGSTIVGARGRLPILGPFSVSLNNAIPGAQVTAEVLVNMWHVMLNIDINVTYYGFDKQIIRQRYNVEDIPCKAFGNTMRTAQVFGILSIFTGFICLALVLSTWFSRLFLPVLWVMTWVNVACVTSVCSMLLKMLCEPSCYGTDQVIPPFMSLAVPEGGFAMYLICMFSYLITSIMTVFI